MADKEIAVLLREVSAKGASLVVVTHEPAQGVALALRVLRDELEIAMALTGCATLADIGPAVLWRP